MTLCVTLAVLEQRFRERTLPPTLRTRNDHCPSRDENVSTTIETLSSLSLPETLGIRRDHIVPEAARPPQFDKHYDFHTLFYDAFFVPEDQTIRLVCPRLLNLEDFVKKAKFTSNGETLKPRLRRRNWRNDEISLRCSKATSELEIRFQSTALSASLGTQDRESFRGLRCAVLKSRNNDLAWITDWARYHAKVHGLEGLVFFDNGSDRYTLKDLTHALAAVEGLKVVRVLSANFPFGPNADGSDIHQAKFLQGALVEIARLRYLQCAASVLLVDIDELVSPVPQSTIFALAEESFLGYVSIPGRWHYPEGTNMALIQHFDHVYVSTTDTPCRSKYCIVPQGRLGNSYWDLHNPGFGRSRLRMVGRNFFRKVFRRVLITNRAEFWHCRQITTHWKYDRDNPPPAQLTLDTASKNVMDGVFEKETCRRRD